MSIKNKVLNCFEVNGVLVLENGNFENLDSISFISVVVEIEDEFSIEFPDEYLLTNNFKNLNSVLSVIESLVED